MSFDNVKEKFQSCELCGSIMQPNPMGVCANCVETDQEQFDTVKRALKLNEVKTIEEVSQSTGVATKHIRRWILRGRLQMAGG